MTAKIVSIDRQIRYKQTSLVYITKIPDITKVIPSPIQMAKVISSWYLSGEISMTYVKMQGFWVQTRVQSGRQKCKFAQGSETKCTHPQGKHIFHHGLSLCTFFQRRQPSESIQLRQQSIQQRERFLRGQFQIFHCR